MRCVHEAQMHEENCFITLTFNDKNLPSDKSVNKKTLQKFMKDLRKELYPKKIRFFGCGEYGEKLKRPHYHVALFGHDFPDKEIIFMEPKKSGSRPTARNNILHNSKALREIWKKGFVTVGNLTFESAGYVARYVTKKINGEKYEKHYKGKNQEFALMSRNKGIGYEWIKKYWNDVYPKDFVTIRGKKMRPCKYYDTYMEKTYPEMFKEIKLKRIEQEEKSDEESGENWRNYEKYKHRKLITKTLDRKFERS